MFQTWQSPNNSELFGISLCIASYDSSATLTLFYYSNMLILLALKFYMCLYFVYKRCEN